MYEFIGVYLALGLAAFGGNLVTKKDTRGLGIVSLGAAAAIGAVIAIALTQ